MTEKQKGRWLKRVVLYCICFTSAMLVACYIAAWYGVDTYEIGAITCGVFGGELMVTGAIKLFDKEYGSKTVKTVPMTAAAKAAKKEEASNG